MSAECDTNKDCVAKVVGLDGKTVDDPTTQSKAGEEETKKTNLTEDRVRMIVEEMLVSPVERRVYVGLLEEHAKELRVDLWVKGAFVLVSSIAITALGIWTGWAGIKEALTKHVTVELAKEEVAKVINNDVSGMISNNVPSIISDQVPEMISNKVSILESEMLKRFLDQHTLLTEQEHHVTDRIELISTMLAATMGSRHDYDKLCQLKSSKNDVSPDVARIVDWIQRRYQLKALRREDCPLVLRENGKQYAPGVYIATIHDVSGINSAAAVNDLASFGRKEYVESLVYAVQNTDHLDTLYLAIIGIKDLTGESFSALGADEVLKWWSLNSTNEVYKNSYERHLESIEMPNRQAEIQK